MVWEVGIWPGRGGKSTVEDGLWLKHWPVFQEIGGLYLVLPDSLSEFMQLGDSLWASVFLAIK